MRAKYALINVMLLKIIIMSFLTALVIGLGYSALNQKLFVSKCELDKMLLQSEQELLLSSIDGLEKDIAVSRFLLENPKTPKLYKNQQELANKQKSHLEELAILLKNQERILEYQQQILNNNKGLLNSYDGAGRLEYEIERTHLLLRDLSDFSKDQNLSLIHI